MKKTRNNQKSINEIQPLDILNMFTDESTSPEPSKIPQNTQPTKKQEIKYYLTEGMTEIIPLAEEDWRTDKIDMTDYNIDGWSIKLQQSKNRIKVSQELQDKLDTLPFADWSEIHETMFKVEYSVLEGEVTLMAYLKR